MLHALLVAGGPLGCGCPHWRRLSLLAPSRTAADDAPRREAPRLQLVPAPAGDRERAEWTGAAFAVMRSARSGAAR